MKITLDTRNFDKALNEYQKFCKKAPAEIANAKCWFIARNATATTDATTREKITSELMAPSKAVPEVPLAQILVQKQNKAAGGVPLSGSALKQAIKKFINKRISSIHFLRSGWLPAVRLLTQAVQRGDISFSKAFAPKLNSSVKQKGKDKGSARYARPNVDKTYAEIENAIQGGNKEHGSNSEIHERLEEGLQKAIDKEVSSMQQYIERKYNEQIEKFNR